MKFGLIGLGQIGGNLADWLVSNGHDISGFDIDPKAAARAEGAGVHIVSSRADLIAQVDLVVTSLPSLAAIEETYFAEDGLIAGHREGLVTVECSTVPPDFARRITTNRQRAGGIAMEAAVVGVGADAAAGRLFFIVSGAEADLPAVRPFLEVAGRAHRHVGDSGTAAITKVLNNGVGAATLCAIAEALALAETFGIAPDAIVDVMVKGAGAGASTVLERHGRFMAGASPPRPFNPIAQKDAAALGEMLDRKLSAAVPALAGMVETYRRELATPDVAAPEQLARAARERIVTAL